MWIALAVVVAIVAVIAGPVVAPARWPFLLRQAAPVGLLAIGQTVLIIGRGFDLSVGGLVGLVNVLAASAFAREIGGGNVMVIVLVVGALVGACNGLLVAWGKLSPLVVTLGMGFVLTGVMLVVSGGAPSGEVPAAIRTLALPGLLGLSWGTWIWIVMSLVVGLALAKTWPGRWVYAIGANPEAARLTGISLEWTRFWSYTLSGFCAALGGLLLAGFVGVGSLGAGQDLLMSSLAATVVGGTLLAGGRGGLLGTFGGAILLAVLAASLTALGAGTAGNQVIQGTVILAAAAAYRRKHTT
ncbi:MAG: ABC transporter permease [Propionicimonas sp.]